MLITIIYNLQIVNCKIRIKIQITGTFSGKKLVLHQWCPHETVILRQYSLQWVKSYVLPSATNHPSSSSFSPTASCRPWDGTFALRTRTASTPSATTSTSWLWILRRRLRWSHRSVFVSCWLWLISIHHKFPSPRWCLHDTCFVWPTDNI